MSQGSAVAATTGTRRFSRLRSLLMLGGFVMIWWCLATGTAQASVGHDPLGETVKSLGAKADRVVHETTHRTVDRGHAEKRTTTVTKKVRHHVAPVRTVVEKTVRELPVKPAVTQVTQTVRSQVVVPVLAETRAALAKTALPKVLKPVLTPVLSPVLSPVLEGTDTATGNLPVAGISAALQGETVSNPHLAGRDAAPSSKVATQAPAALVADSSATADAAQAQAAPSSPAGQRDHDRNLRSSGSTGASAGQSGSGAGGAAATQESGMAITPPTTKTSISTPAGRPLGGPAYPPSSSPD